MPHTPFLSLLFLLTLSYPPALFGIWVGLRRACNQGESFTKAPLIYLFVVELILLGYGFLFWPEKLSFTLQLGSSWLLLLAPLFAAIALSGELVVLYYRQSWNRVRFAAIRGGLPSLLTLAAAFPEEFLYRGFAFTIIQQDLAQPTWLAWLLSSLLFALLHGRWGVRQMGAKFFTGIVYGLLFWWGQTVWLPLLVHFLQNLAVLLLGWWRRV